MAILPVRIFGDPILKEKALPVKEINQDIKGLIKNLAETMYKAPGMGLAAPQIGILKQVIVFDLENEEGLCAYLNPKITWFSEETEEAEEGCLSLLETRILITRPAKVNVEALTLEGKIVKFLAEGLLARVFQHEIDHLNGILIIDRANESERKKALQQMNQFLQISSP